MPLDLPPPREGTGNTIGLRLHGTAWSDNLAWLGRLAQSLTFLGPIHRRLQWYRRQNKNRQIRIRALVAGSRWRLPGRSERGDRC